MTDLERWLIDVWDGPVTHWHLNHNGADMYTSYIEFCPDWSKTMSGTEFYHALWPLAEASEAAGIE
ncbi:hypothetical protein [Burkholderia pseudomallei]|uniref:hypothetical protein n=1 Tax=Burkholderia pseudomallei TaxID=28450 RepID=UPI0019E15194|nr:hypothetical protein [Burkholderia pseudomallei]MBF3831144.1 hypothetical protein [Burkholderia pseudomallei]